MATAADFLVGKASPTVRGGAGAARILALKASLPRAADVIARHAAGIVEDGLVVDLGEGIGSGPWWRGLATLGALCGAVLAIGLNVPSIIGAVPPKRSPAVAEEARLLGITPLAEGSSMGRRLAPTTLAQPLSEAPERPRVELDARVGSGGLQAALRRAGVGREDLDALGQLLAGVVNSSGLSPGTRLDIVLGRRESKSMPRPLQDLKFRAAFDLKVEVSRGPDGALRLKRIPIKVDETPLRVTGEVGRSLQRAARAAGLPANIINEYVRQMSHVLDFQRDMRGQNRFEIIVEHRRAETGETQMGQLLYAGLRKGKEDISLMRWGPRGKFFRANGESAERGLMRTPVVGARTSSGFGMRFHPILGYSRMHQGLDFAARTGTPVIASAAGTVVQAGWGGGYGNLVVIDHGRGLRTRYAHLHRIHVKKGQRVEQGVKVGEVGSTGLSTGPHLHYEVWQNGKAVDPRSAKFHSGSQLTGAELSRFRDRMAQLKRIQAAG